MRNFKLTISYDGSRYDGWQKQGNTAATIQGKLESTLSQLVDAPVEIHGAGRTDAGVHARAQVASVNLNTALTPAELTAALNHFLPQDIVITACVEADPRFHARLSATGKRYIYRLWNSEIPNVFERKYLTPWPQRLDVDAMAAGAALLTGEHDFYAFCANRRYKKSTVRNLSSITVERVGDEVRLTYCGDGFLYNMVRILTGTLVEVGLGERPAQSLPDLFENAQRYQAGRTMPARGLILDEVFYEAGSLPPPSGEGARRSRDGEGHRGF